MPWTGLAQNLHYRSLLTSARLTVYQQADSVSPFEVIRKLNAAGIRFVLVGPHSVGGWMREPRANRTVDVLVARRNRLAAARCLSHLRIRLIPSLESNRVSMMLWSVDEPRATISAPEGPFFRLPFRECHWVPCSKRDGGRFRIPNAEMALAMAYHGATSPAQDWVRRYQHAHDFILIAENNERWNEQRLREICGKVSNRFANRVLAAIARQRNGERVFPDLLPDSKTLPVVRGEERPP